MQCPICIVVTRNKHFSFSNVREEQRSLTKSVKVVMVVPVSLHNQQCDNFRKIQQETAKWTGAVIYVLLYYTSLTTRGPCAL